MPATNIPAPNTNGHQRRKLTRRIKATTTHCALCGNPLNPTATYPAPDATVIDEDLPRARGGNPLDPHNTNALHNHCNRWKSTLTLNEARHLLTLGANLNQPLTKATQKALLTQTTHPAPWSPTQAHW